MSGCEPDEWGGFDEQVHAARFAPLPGTTFRCAECEREVRTDNEVVICRCSDEPTCDPCCEAYHGESAREKAISQGDE